MGEFKKKLCWFISDAFAFICFAIIVPLVPMFALFEEVRSAHEEE